jgi:RNA polymerase sigma-70 factor, ECF subfamily
MQGPEGDSGVVDAARDGDRAAWEQLYRRLYPRLRSYLARRVGFEGVEDAVNETMAKAIAGIEGYRSGPSGFDAWVFGIARHVSADHHRRFARERRQQVVAHHIDGHGPDGDLPVDHWLDLADDYAYLRSMFSRLDPAEQEILELRVIAGLSAGEVATLLRRQPGAVRTSQSRALAHLRRLMEGERIHA